ncbi:MAG: two-component regulator propeller domain-containing protein [Verrucomicrobiota bacterium]
MLTLLLMAAPARAADPKTNSTARYNVRVWQTDEGLPHNTVHAIAQTPDGYLWVGTRAGLARFDGVRFLPLDDAAAPELKHAWITALAVSRDGGLWIASESNGVTCLKDGVFTRFTATDGLPGNQIQCLLESREGSLWLGGDRGLSRFRAGRFTRFTGSEFLRENSVKALCEDARGILRVATVTGLVSINPDGVVSPNNFGSGPVSGVLKAVCEDRQGRLWLGATDGLLRLTDGKLGSYAANKSMPEKITTCLYEDSTGQLWVGTYGGLTRRVNGTLSPWWLNPSPINDLIYTLFEDREQNLWVGGRDGLYRLTPARFVTYTMQDGLNCNNVTSVREDTSGGLWLGTWGGGVNQLHDGRFSAITVTNGLTQDTVLSLFEGRDRSLYVGMDYPGIVNRIKPGGTNDFVRPAGMITAPVRVIHQDQAGGLWIGTSKGLNLLRDGALQTFTATNGLPGDNITALCESRAGPIWIGTDGGLSRWADGKFENITDRDNLPPNDINAIYEDNDETLWVGTKTGGLNRWRTGQWRRYTTAQGLFSDEIYEIVEDDRNYLWMSCRRGIFRVSKPEFAALDQGTIPALTSTHFVRADGLTTVQCNGVAKPAGWKTPDGQIWFPTIRGVVAVQPDLRLNAQPPPVWIEEVRAGSHLLRTGYLLNSVPASVTVPAGSGDLEIHYTALSLQVPEKVRFRHRLEGLDQEWTAAGTERRVTYNNLAPGRYRFTVIAANNDGVWNETGATLPLLVLPQFWQTWSFKLALLAVPALVLAWAYQTRVRRLREIEQLRIRIASDLHDDVGSRLTKVAMITEQVERETDANAARPHIHMIARTTRDITRAMDEIVWTINPKNDTLDHLANYIFHYAQEYFQNTGVRCRLDLPSSLPEHTLPTEYRHNLFMAVKEALQNILKHAGAAEARIRLAVTGNQLTIVITDNGRGFAADRAHPGGDGLVNMRARLLRIGGSLRIESTPGHDTTITLEAPLP